MARAARQDQPGKFARYRAAQRARGLKLLRIWVRDPNTTAFRAEASRQAALLRGTEGERDALDFIERTMADLDLPPYEPNGGR